MFPSMLVIVLLRSTMGALPWSARGSKQRVHVRETKKRRKRARSGRAPRVCAECTFGHTLQHANTTLLLQKICFSCNMFLRMILRTLSSCSNGFPSRGLGMHGRGRPVVECACNSEKQGGNFLHNRQRFSANFGPIILVPIFFCPDFPSFQSFSTLKCAWWDCFRTRVTATLLADRVIQSGCGTLFARSTRTRSAETRFARSRSGYFFRPTRHFGPYADRFSRDVRVLVLLKRASRTPDPDTFFAAHDILVRMRIAFGAIYAYS